MKKYDKRQMPQALYRTWTNPPSGPTTLAKVSAMLESVADVNHL